MGVLLSFLVVKPGISVLFLWQVPVLGIPSMAVHDVRWEINPWTACHASSANHFLLCWAAAHHLAILPHGPQSACETD